MLTVTLIHACLRHRCTGTHLNKWAEKTQEEAFRTHENTLLAGNSSAALCVYSVSSRQIINLVLLENWNGLLVCWWLRALPALPGCQGQFLTPETPVPEDPAPSSPFQGHCAHVWSWKKHIYIQTQRAWKTEAQVGWSWGEREQLDSACSQGLWLLQR